LKVFELAGSPHDESNLVPLVERRVEALVTDIERV